MTNLQFGKPNEQGIKKVYRRDGDKLIDQNCPFRSPFALPDGFGGFKIAQCACQTDCPLLGEVPEYGGTETVMRPDLMCSINFVENVPDN